MITKPKVGLYSPYLHILGGGERYFISIAEALCKDYEVCIITDKKSLPKKIEHFLNIPLSKINFLGSDSFFSSTLKKYLFLKKFQLFFYMTDGSIFFPVAKKNFLMIQSPIHIPRLSILNKIKLFGWRPFCYGSFMKKIIEEKLRKEVKILSPYVDSYIFKNDMSKKKNIILTVGRFFSYPHSKKHDILLKAFIANRDRYFKNWKLVIAGGLTETSGRKMLAKLNRLSKGYPVEIYVNLSFGDLLTLYKQAKIYWHAAGYNEDLDNFPEKAEHFGITTLEAMAAGLVPIVFNAGGQKDIVRDGVSGYLWNSSEELIKKTASIIRDKKLLKHLSNGAKLRAKDFSYERFNKQLQEIIS